jgi:hypothetical protein
MTDHELDAFEQQLRRTKPAKPPEDFAARLGAAEPKKIRVESEVIAPSIPVFFRNLRLSLRWLIPTTAVAVAGVVAWQGSQPFVGSPPNLDPASRANGNAEGPLIKADDVKVNQQLVSSFDAVARLPDGEPVRFRCENWMDQVVVSDKTRGLVVENSRPRVEVVPVGFETY